MANSRTHPSLLPTDFSATTPSFLYSHEFLLTYNSESKIDRAIEYQRYSNAWQGISPSGHRKPRRIHELGASFQGLKGIWGLISVLYIPAFVGIVRFSRLNVGTTGAKLPEYRRYRVRCRLASYHGSSYVFHQRR